MKWENQEYMILEYGVGSGAWENIVLPINKLEKGRLFDNGLCFDNKNSLLVVQGETFLNSVINDTAFIVINLATHGQQFIIEKGKTCNAYQTISCIDTISINDKVLYYKWKADTDSNNKKGSERRVRITI